MLAVSELSERANLTVYPAFRKLSVFVEHAEGATEVLERLQSEPGMLVGDLQEKLSEVFMAEGRLTERIDSVKAELEAKLAELSPEELWTHMGPLVLDAVLLMLIMNPPLASVKAMVKLYGATEALIQLKAMPGFDDVVKTLVTHTEPIFRPMLEPLGMLSDELSNMSDGVHAGVSAVASKVGGYIQDGEALVTQFLGIQRSAEDGDGAAEVTPQATDAMKRSTAQALPSGVRKEMEGAMGHDFSSVRIHTDQHANREQNEPISFSIISC